MAANQAVSRGNAERDSIDTQIPIATVFQAIAGHYEQDLREFFARANFYLAVHAVLLSAIGIREVPDSRFDWAVTVVIASAGVVLACVWGLVSHGSVMWIRRWRREIRRLSLVYSPTDSYHAIEQYASRQWYQSPEELTKFLPWFFAVVWVALPIVLWVAFRSSELYEATPLVA